MSKVKSFVVSTNSKNTKRIVVPTGTIDLRAFSDNPIMYYNHVPGEVIGNWTNTRVVDDKLLSDPVFDLVDEFSAKISGKVERGFIKAASIGIRNVEAVKLTDEEGEYWEVTKCELREISICDIPSNRNSLALYDADDNEINLSEANFSDLFETETKIKKSTMDKKKIAAILGLSDDADEAQINAAIKSAVKDSEDLKTLKGDIAQKQKAKAITLADEAIADGRMAKEAKDGFLELADVNFDSFEKTVNALSKPVSLSDVARGGAAASVKIGADRKDWTFSDWQKKDSKGLAKLQESDSEKYMALYDAEFGE